MMAPALRKVEEEYKGVKVKRVDVDKERGLADEYRVDAVPTLVFLVNEEEVGRHVGALNEEELKELFLKQFLPQAKVGIMEWAKGYAERGGFLLNSDEKELSRLLEALSYSLLKFGKRYCPCRVRKEENVCPCIHHREEIEEKGSCLCGLFLKR
jgi:ferredoxin-thioredoxin reductase catalytic subunit